MMRQFVIIAFAAGMLFAVSYTGIAQAVGEKQMNATRLLLRWESQQQMNWNVRIQAQGFRFVAIPLAKLDNGDAQKITVSPDGAMLTIESVTGWNTASALVEIARGNTETVAVEIRDPYVKDRFTKDQFALTDIQHERTIHVSSKEWPVRNCLLRFSLDPVEIEQETQLLKTLGDDRRMNIDALLSHAEKAKDNPRHLQLLLRAAAACSGGCNHRPLIADGWDRAISIYQRIIDENQGTDVALDAMWAQASCYACWSPLADCDQYGRGKGDWKSAYLLYEKLYHLCRAPADKADALRRMAEVQCFEAGDYDAGLRNYRRIAEEFPTALPPSTRWTYRTCAPACGTDRLAWDIYRALVYNASTARAVPSLFTEYFGTMRGNPHVEELSRYVASSAENGAK